MPGAVARPRGALRSEEQLRNEGIKESIDREFLFPASISPGKPSSEGVFCGAVLEIDKGVKIRKTLRRTELHCRHAQWKNRAVMKTPSFHSLFVTAAAFAATIAAGQATSSLIPVQSVTSTATNTFNTPSVLIGNATDTAYVRPNPALGGSGTSWLSSQDATGTLLTFFQLIRCFGLDLYLGLRGLHAHVISSKPV